MAEVKPTVVYTIGHSTHPVGQFLLLLRQHGITAVGDVRSTPFSRFNPQFNRQTLKASLEGNGIAYVFLGAELGARSDDDACYENGKVQYDRLAATALFQHGLARVQEGTARYRIALMCAEKEPLDCHRTILVARHVVARGFDVQHIHADGQLESHDELMMRLARQLDLPAAGLLNSRDELFAEAYRRHGARIAYERRPALKPRQ
jgi:uncharacterized protein (DUF488 family)